MSDHVTFVGPARVSMIINGQAVAIGKIAAAEIERLRAEVVWWKEKLKQPCQWCEIESRCSNGAVSDWGSDGRRDRKCACICHIRRALDGEEVSDERK